MEGHLNLRIIKLDFFLIILLLNLAFFTTAFEQE